MFWRLLSGWNARSSCMLISEALFLGQCSSTSEGFMANGMTQFLHFAMEDSGMAQTNNNSKASSYHD